MVRSLSLSFQNLYIIMLMYTSYYSGCKTSRVVILYTRFTDESFGTFFLLPNLTIFVYVMISCFTKNIYEKQRFYFPF